jgi:hypothetical protein
MRTLRDTDAFYRVSTSSQVSYFRHLTLYFILDEKQTYPSVIPNAKMSNRTWILGKKNCYLT